MANDKLKKNCRVCGLVLDDPPWGEDGATPSFDYCPCCGVEFGYQDCSTEAAKHYRKCWISEGANWAEKNEMPFNWSLEEQLKNIPNEFK
ncbi:putative uncharacterized protein [Waddlia chondrophila 2032/99]|nr:hypothetical protein [Waddlia chondrophila]CCB91991.1 putative uncharacterized protein [Waddlia chondrophila 2032/99]